MKINIKLSIISILYISICANAQSNVQERALKVGDKAPPINVFKWIKGVPVVEFKKGQVYIVEFGATWCHPCAEAIPHLTEIAKKYGDKLNVIGVFVMELQKDSKDISYISNVEKYVRKQGDGMIYNIAVDGPKRDMDNAWTKKTGISGIPQTFIIDKKGIIAWIGNPNSEIFIKVIGLLISDSYRLADEVAEGQVRKKPTVDPIKPLFIDGNGGDGKNYIYRSIITKYNGELNDGVLSGTGPYVHTGTWEKINSDRQPYSGMVQQIGAPLGMLYYIAYADTIGNMVATRHVDGTENYPDTIKYPSLRNSYGKYWYRPILEIKDTATNFSFSYKSFENRYNYSLIIPNEKANAKLLQEAMQRDLKTYFGYEVTVEDRLMPYWKLSVSGNAKYLLRCKMPSGKFGATQVNDTLYRYNNAIMKDILIRLIISFSFGHSSFGVRPIIEAPFIDETGITDEIDYDISDREFQEIKKGNWDVALEFLHRLGLELLRGERLTKVVVISDPPK